MAVNKDNQMALMMMVFADFYSVILSDFGQCTQRNSIFPIFHPDIVDSCYADNYLGWEGIKLKN